jgi:hypothetical protein
VFEIERLLSTRAQVQDSADRLDPEAVTQVVDAQPLELLPLNAAQLLGMLSPIQYERLHSAQLLA